MINFSNYLFIASRPYYIFMIGFSLGFPETYPKSSHESSNFHSAVTN